MSSIRDYYSPEEGLIVNRNLAGRSFILGSSVWERIEERLYKDFGTGASVILFEMGQACGISQAIEAKKANDSEPARNVISLLALNATNAGWGKVIISTIDESVMRVNVANCVFCSNVEDKDRVERCQFLKGMILGLAHEILNRDYRIKETHCSKKYCEFFLTAAN